MTVETFFANFGHLADAPNGVQKLRELILQLAVQGKLVSQDPNEPPARELLKEIEADKHRLVKAGEIKSPKPLPPITPKEVPYVLPQGWEWKRLPDITFFQEGPGILKKDFRNAGIPLIRIAGMHTDTVSSDGCNFLDESMVDKKWSHFQLDLGDVVLSSSASLGKVSKVGSGAVGCIVYTGLIRFKPYAGLLDDFLIRFLNSDEFVRQINQSKTGAAIKHFGPTHLKKMIIPLPPLEEQKRIVAKVDQLMSLCNELETRQQKQQQGRVRLNNAALDALLTAREPDKFADHWQRISTNFDLLYDHPETIAKLRAVILQLAVQGKLVPQDPNDEPASVLLERIKAEKERLVKERKIRKPKTFPPVEGSDDLFELPGNWQWDKFANVILSSEAGWSPQCEKWEREGNEWGVLKVSAVSWDVFKPHENKALPSGLEPRPQYEVKVGDFLLSRANTLELVAKSVVVEDSPPKLMMSDKLIRLRLSENVERRFFNIFNNCSIARSYYAHEASGTSSSMRNVSRECILNMPIPVPPVEEQKRIVAKVDQLMALCDELEAKLNQAQQQSAKLMEATVRQLLVA